MSSRAAAIGADAQAARERTDALARSAGAIRTALEGDLRAPADAALQGVGVLVGAVVELDGASRADPVSDETIALIRRCKADSGVVHARFEELYGKARELLERCTAVWLFPVEAVARLTVLFDFSCRLTSRTKPGRLKFGLWSSMTCRPSRMSFGFTWKFERRLGCEWYHYLSDFRGITKPAMQ